MFNCSPILVIRCNKLFMTVQYHNGIIDVMLSRRLLLMIALILIVGGSIAAGAWWLQKRSVQKKAEQAALDAATQLAAQRQDFFSSSDRLIFFLSLGDEEPILYGANAVSKTVQPLAVAQPDIYSNYLPDQQQWYSVADQTLLRYGSGEPETIIALANVPVMASAVITQPSLAVNPAEQYLAYISRVDYTEHIRLLNLATLQDTELYEAEPTIHLANLTWSPNGTELAFTSNGTKIITVTVDGAETYTPISLPFHEFSFVSWITLNDIAAVVSSTNTNPEPFQPKIMVFDRSGNAIEEHDVFEKIGVPRVVWSGDGSQFMFYNPWQNTFVIYNRYDQLIQSLSVAAPGKLVPFGYAAGTGPFVLTPPQTDTATSTTNTDATEPFEVTAEDWERYNTVVRNILKQWQIDFSTYRFATTESGIKVTFAVQADAKATSELIFIQTILQAFAVLPNVPTITVVLHNAAGEIVWEVEELSRTVVNDVSQLVTGRPVEELFVINAQNPVGKRTTKSNNPAHHYVGDFVYSRFGDYNPYPVLSLLGATTTTQQFYATTSYTVLYPATLDVRSQDDRTALFYTGETTFLSPTAWSEFGLTIKVYDAPDVTLEQWLSVNRPDQTAETADFTPHQPGIARHIITDTTYTDEYVIMTNNNVYVLTVQRDDGLTDDDSTLLQAITESFSLYYAVQRY